MSDNRIDDNDDNEIDIFTGLPFEKVEKVEKVEDNKEVIKPKVNNGAASTLNPAESAGLKATDYIGSKYPFDSNKDYSNRKECWIKSQSIIDTSLVEQLSKGSRNILYYAKCPACRKVNKDNSDLLHLSIMRDNFTCKEIKIELIKAGIVTEEEKREHKKNIIDEVGAIIPLEEHLKITKCKTDKKDVKGNPIYEIYELEAVYKYSKNGEIYGVVPRYKKEGARKTFPTYYRGSDGLFCYTNTKKGEVYVNASGENKWHPYNIDEVSNGDTVYVVEGEKKVEVMRSLGLIAICSKGGAQQYNGTDWSSVVKKKIIILPDNDNAGISYAYRVKEILEGFGNEVVIKNIQGEEEGYDIADFYDDNISKGKEFILSFLKDLGPLQDIVVKDSFKDSSDSALLEAGIEQNPVNADYSVDYSNVITHKSKDDNPNYNPFEELEKLELARFNSNVSKKEFIPRWALVNEEDLYNALNGTYLGKSLELVDLNNKDESGNEISSSCKNMNFLRIMCNYAVIACLPKDLQELLDHNEAHSNYTRDSKKNNKEIKEVPRGKDTPWWVFAKSYFRTGKGRSPFNMILFNAARTGAGKDQFYDLIERFVEEYIVAGDSSLTMAGLDDKMAKTHPNGYIRIEEGSKLFFKDTGGKENILDGIIARANKYNLGTCRSERTNLGNSFMGYRAMNSCISMQLDALTKGTLTAEFFERGGGRRSIFCPEETTGNHIYNYKMSYCVEKIDNYEREANAIYDSLTRLNGCYNILSDETNKYQDAISNQIISDLLATGEDGQLINDMCNFLQLYLNRIAFFIQSFNLGTAENRIFSEHVWKRVEIITNVIVRGCVKSHYLRTSNVQEEKREDDINNIFNCVITEFRRAKTLIIPLKELRRILSKGKAKVNTDSFDSYIAEFKKRTSNNKPWIFIDSEGNCQLNNPIENVDERFNKSERIKKSNLKDAKGVTCKDGKYKKWYSAIDVYKYKLELIQDKERAFYFIPENKDMRFNKDEAMQNLELTQEQIEENVVATDGKFKEWWKELGYNSFDAMVLKNNEIGDRDAKTAQTLQQYLDCMEPRVKQESGESGEQGEESGEQNIMEI